jgi:septum formation protein
LVLASASPARLAVLRGAGLSPEVVVSHVDESTATQEQAPALAAELAEMKARAVAERLEDGDALVLGCDSVLSLAGAVYGKPGDEAEATARWRVMRGRTGTLVTGHCVVDQRSGRRVVRTARTDVSFAMVSDAEIDAYVSTGEPLQVAGAFTIDGLGGAFVTGVQGDPHNVVGVSLPLLRTMLAELGIAWTSLWRDGAATG